MSMDFSLKDSFKEYEKMQARTSGEKSNLINAALGLCGEAGEVADLIKKSEFQGHELSEEKLVEELGDILWYISEAARLINVSLCEIAEKNILKLKKRYPDGFSTERSVNREEYGKANNHK